MAKKWVGLMVLLMSIIVSSVVFAQEKKKVAEPKTSAAKQLAASFTDAVTGMEFVLVKGGCYQMGDNFGDGIPEEELPVHEVCVNDFYLGKYHVTNEQFKKFIEATGYRTTAEEKGTGRGLERLAPGKWEDRPGLNWRQPIYLGDSIGDRMNHPVLQMSWYDAKEFAKWLGAKTGKPYRLAYEAEYEYAIRSGGKKYKYSWGNGDPTGRVANVADKTFMTKFPYCKECFDNYEDGYVITSPVGSFQPNEIGLYDMTGNAWSWVEDWFSKEYYKSSPKNNPHGPEMGEHKVARGGSWVTARRTNRASYRVDVPPDSRYYNFGFRLALPAQ